MKFEETKKVLIKFAKDVIAEAKKNLKKDKKNTSGALSRSLKYKDKIMPNSFLLQFEMADYGEYQDAGVDGVNKRYGKRKYGRKTFKYKRRGGKNSLKGMPPPSAFDKWVVKKGGKFNQSIRDSKGRFINRQSLTFVLAKSIFEKGIKPSYFFSSAFEKAYKKLPKEFIAKYELDIDKFITHTLKDYNGTN
jgi:hypothetical protein|tara:strand:+ start:5655 stop:6227 length:573 start_codon:yes stop_codon:yes gene_type:complete